MKGLRIQLPDELEEKFRILAMQIFGYSKGSLSKAAEEAIRNWLESIEIPKSQLPFENSVDVIEGLLKDVDIDSVKLQHKITDIWIKKVLENVSD